MLSLAATALFLLLVGSLLGNTQTVCGADPWAVKPHGLSQEASSSNQASSLEHALVSPTPLHAYQTLPGAAAESMAEYKRVMASSVWDSELKH